MNKELMKLLKRQSAIVGKISKGDASDDEKKELDALNKKIEELSNPEAVEVGKTELTTMTVAEFKKHVQSEQSDATAKLDTKRLALLKRNLDSVKKQAKKSDDDIVAVEVLVEAEKQDERLDSIEEKMGEIFELIKNANFDGRGTTGLVDGDADGDAGGDGDGDAGGDGAGDGTGDTANKTDEMPVSTAAALEALTAMIGRYEKVKSMVAEGKDFSSDDLYKMWPGWELREAVEQSVEVLAKLEALKELMDAVNPELEKIAKEKDDAGKDNDDSDDDDSDDDDPSKVDKSDKVSKWASGGDMAEGSSTTKDQYDECKKHSKLDF